MCSPYRQLQESRRARVDTDSLVDLMPSASRNRPINGDGLGGPVAPRRGKVGKVDQAFTKLGMTVIGTFDHSDRHSMVGLVQQFDRVAGAEFAVGVDRQVRAGAGGVGETLDETGVTHPETEFEAGNPRFGDSQQCTADPPALAYKAVGEVDTGDGEVLAERSRLGAAPSTAPHHS